MAGFDEQKVYGYDPRTGNWFPILVDHAGHLVAHSILEMMIHDGFAYATGHYIASVSNGSNLDILVQAGDASELYTKLVMKSGGDALLTVYESPTFSNAGTVVTSTNLNRNSANTLDVATISHTPTITDVGTAIFQSFIPGGGFLGSGGSGEFEQGVFKTNEDYLLRFNNSSGIAQPMQVQLLMYEHQPNGL